jgi:hypothetical protein
MTSLEKSTCARPVTEIFSFYDSEEEIVPESTTTAMMMDMAQITVGTHSRFILKAP